MRLTQIRYFHNWKPGSIYTPTPLRQLDLHDEYTDRLKAAVDANIPLLSAHLKTEANQKTIIHKLLSSRSDELKKIKKHRITAPKREWAPSEEYAAFLRHLYSKILNEKKLLLALRRLPGSEQRKQALYINASHLETLITRSMEVPRLFRYVSELLESAHLARTARELATNVISIAQQGGDWRRELAHCWPQILESHDTGAYNQLLKLALKFHCRDTQSLVQYHLRTKANRFTYLLKLRYQRDVSPSDILKEFRAQHCVLDSIVISSYISGLLRLGRPRGVRAAEEAYNGLVAANCGQKPVFGNHNKLGNILVALDSVSQCINRPIEVPLYADSRLFDRMYTHYVAEKRDDKAIDVLITTAMNGNIPPRHAMASHVRLIDTEEQLERLFYLCCDLNLSHPGFISNSFAEIWVKTLVAKKGMIYEDANQLVANCRAVAPSNI